MVQGHPTLVHVVYLTGAAQNIVLFQSCFQQGVVLSHVIASNSSSSRKSLGITITQIKFGVPFQKSMLPTFTIESFVCPTLLDHRFPHNANDIDPCLW